MIGGAKMPLIKSAKKKLKQDKKRTEMNAKYISAYKKIIEKIKKKKAGKGADLIKQAYKALDKAVKKNIIHKNKASRLKSSVAKLLKKGS